ncbi:MAG: hypothetical protein JHC26_02670 [Thermofilum sp.]|jgi:hypothetical protein|uniref:hypothetical protein n=1 Tax=Thermofilum sp. TaxID=1961369 RepID=UPI0025886AAA|nr:hypothetical protein [Thermofilum sp.]MCI4407969.1 hypothetical protein [Thermofilum sp.]
MRKEELQHYVDMIARVLWSKDGVIVIKNKSPHVNNRSHSLPPIHIVVFALDKPIFIRVRPPKKKRQPILIVRDGDQYGLPGTYVSVAATRGGIDRLAGLVVEAVYRRRLELGKIDTYG